MLWEDLKYGNQTRSSLGRDASLRVLQLHALLSTRFDVHFHMIHSWPSRFIGWDDCETAEDYLIHTQSLGSLKMVTSLSSLLPFVASCI